MAQQWFSIVPLGANRFLHEPTAKGCAQKIRSLGHSAEVIAEDTGFTVRLYAKRETADEIGEQLLRRVINAADSVSQMDPGVARIGYDPADKFLRRTADQPVKMTPAFDWNIF